MKNITPYLRVLAGFIAGVGTWLVVVDLIHGKFSDAFIGALIAAGLWYLALGKPIREHFARVKAEQAALAARADAGHAAYLAGDPVAFAPPPEPPTRRPVRRGVIIAAAVAALLVVYGIINDIGDGLDDESEDTATSTAAVPTSEAAAAPTSVQVRLAPTATQAAAPPVASTSSAQAAVAADSAVMPNMVCMNLQDAQNTIQAAGVFYSRSDDATGRGRAQIVDRNWVVVSQSPAPGVLFGEGDAVLSAVKAGEPGDCS